MNEPSPPSEPDILYEDPYLIAVNKPSGLLVHPSWIAPARTPNLLALLKRRYVGEPIHTVHRLDRATSGVLLFARSADVARNLQSQFVEHRVQKTYLCVTRGWIEDSGVIDYALKPIYDRIADKGSNPDKEAQAAVTHFRRLASVELPIAVGRYPVARYSLVEVEPQTGRKHQIRRHMKHLLHPLVGDTKYGEGRHNRLFREHFGVHRLLLMATSIAFEHPASGESLRLSAPVTAEVDALFRRLGWEGCFPTAKA